MPVFPKPKFDFAYDIASESDRLRDHKKVCSMLARSAHWIDFAFRKFDGGFIGNNRRRSKSVSLFDVVGSY